MIDNNSVIAYLGIGSNLGNRKKNIELAITLLNEYGISVVLRSRLIETLPVGGPPNQNNYLNGVIKIETTLSPEHLLNTLKTIERTLGRAETVRNGPRPIDLDILLYGRLKLRISRLTIPHPRMLERDFVMNPLKEIEPQLFATLLKNKRASLANNKKKRREELANAPH